MRAPVFAANWKMNHGPTEARAFMAAFLAAYTPRTDRTVAIFPPALALASARNALGARTDIAIGVQNIHGEDKVSGLTLRNTLTGIEGIDPAVKAAALGVGMTQQQSLWMVELPLALPVIMAGIRTAAVINVGTATLAAFTAIGVDVARPTASPSRSMTVPRVRSLRRRSRLFTCYDRLCGDG